MTDDFETLFKDMTDWSVMADNGDTESRYNDPALLRSWAEHAAKVRRFLSDNYVRWPRITASNLGSGMSKARAPWAILKLGDKTDIEAGTVTREDAGDPDNEKSSPFNPMYWPPAPSASAFGAPGYVFGGWAVARPLEYSARKKGVQFMLNRHMDQIIREPGGASSASPPAIRRATTPRRARASRAGGRTAMSMTRPEHPHPRPQGGDRRLGRIHGQHQLPFDVRSAPA